MSENFIIRKAKVSDAEDIYYINKSSLGYEYPLEKQRKRLEAVLNDNTQVIFVADIGNKVVGYIHLTNYDVIYTDNYKNCLGLSVHNDYKRMGIGSALLKQGEMWAKENGAVGIRLCSGIERENAHKFYLSQGYVENKLQKNLKKSFDTEKALQPKCFYYFQNFLTKLHLLHNSSQAFLFENPL